MRRISVDKSERFRRKCLISFKAELSKSEISDMIEGQYYQLYFEGILKAYFYDARDQYGGFKFLAMKALYKNYPAGNTKEIRQLNSGRSIIK